MSNETVKIDQTKKSTAEAVRNEVSVTEFLSAFYDDDEIIFIKLFEDKKEKEFADNNEVEKDKYLPPIQFF